MSMCASLFLSLFLSRLFSMAAAHCVIRKTVLLGRTELALVQSQREIVSPDIDVFANPLE